MWVNVLASDTGTPILNASFSLAWWNNGNGWYWVDFTMYNQYFICSAPGRASFYGNNDTYSAMQLRLAPYVPPPPPPPNCWS